MNFRCPYYIKFFHHSDDPMHLLRFTGSAVNTFFCGAIAKIGSRPSDCWSPRVTQNYAHPVGLNWTSVVQLVSPANTSDQNIHAPSGIRNHYSSNQAVSDLHLTPPRPPGLARCNDITYYVIFMEGAIKWIEWQSLYDRLISLQNSSTENKVRYCCFNLILRPINFLISSPK
jgi:hypothetical protein